MSEERYEAIEMTIKMREDGKSWSDVLLDFITENCEGTDSDEDDCTCGLQAMGGMSGTLDQCYEWGQNVSAGISPIMLARTIIALWESHYGDPDTTDKVIQWARKEIEFEEYFENREWENEDEEEEEEEESMGDESLS